MTVYVVGVGNSESYERIVELINDHQLGKSNKKLKLHNK